MTALGHEEIRRLDVTMNDSAFVSCVEGVGNLNAERQHRLDVHRPPGDRVLQRQSIQKLHGDEGLAMLVVHFVDGADVGMVQRRSGLGLTLESAKSLRIFGNFIGQELEGNKTAEIYVLSIIDNTPATATELLDDAVVRNGLADHSGTSVLGGPS